MKSILYSLRSIWIAGLFIAISNFIYAEANPSIWKADTSVVGAIGFQYRTVIQPSDYSGAVFSTIIRKMSEADKRTGKAVLYVHGFNDYFFQGEMADSFISKGYDFYAVDLRKYGRSLRAGQKPAQVRSFDEYIPDLDSALVQIRNDGDSAIVLMGHSTGGLVTTYFMKRQYEMGNQRSIDDIKCLLLNSPFLDWNLGWKESLVPFLSFLGKFFPNIPIHQSGSGYSHSLLKEFNGEWTYNVEWKRINSMDVDLGWIRAVDQAQHFVRKDKWPIEIPILLMHSSVSVTGSNWSRNFNSADCVLDVNDIRKYGRELGPYVTSISVKGGLHDLFLSSPTVRNALYDYTFSWLGEKMLSAQSHNEPFRSCGCCNCTKP